MTDHGTYARRIRDKISVALAPARLVVEDQSARHAGHAGADPAGETHFRVTVVADAFQGRSRAERHRQIYTLLAEELADRVHALSLRTHTPEEDDARA